MKLLRAFLLSLSLAAATPALASDTTGYAGGFAAANPHLAAATSYLRTGNDDLAAIELDGFISTWSDMLPALAESGFRAERMRDLETATAALALIDAGKPAQAREALLGLRKRLYELNRAEGISSFADCIYAANGQGAPLWPHIRTTPDLGRQEVVTAIVSSAETYRSALEGCDASAPDAVKADTEFRRLIDNAVASLKELPGAAQAGNNGLVHRYLIELISIDRLLYFRFG